MPFTAYGQNQRPALLEVQNPNLTPNHLIYVAFGAFQNSIVQPAGLYHGWLLSYTTDSYGNLSQPTVQGSPLQFNTSTKGTGSVAWRRPEHRSAVLRRPQGDVAEWQHVLPLAKPLRQPRHFLVLHPWAGGHQLRRGNRERI
jgi:hypothetical protein